LHFINEFDTSFKIGKMQKDIYLQTGNHILQTSHHILQTSHHILQTSHHILLHVDIPFPTGVNIFAMVVCVVLFLYNIL
jgi:hypothetical protein